MSVKWPLQLTSNLFFKFSFRMHYNGSMTSGKDVQSNQLSSTHYSSVSPVLTLLKYSCVVSNFFSSLKWSAEWKNGAHICPFIEAGCYNSAQALNWPLDLIICQPQCCEHTMDFIIWQPQCCEHTLDPARAKFRHSAVAERYFQLLRYSQSFSAGTGLTFALPCHYLHHLLICGLNKPPPSFFPAFGNNEYFFWHYLPISSTSGRSKELNQSWYDCFIIWWWSRDQQSLEAV